MKKHLFMLVTCFIIFINIVLFFAANGQAADSSQVRLQRQSGAIMITGYITISAKDMKQYLIDSLKWQQLTPLKKYYAGKKIKRILYQKSTDRLIVFASGNLFQQLNKITAIHEGLIKADTTITWTGEKTSYLPLQPIQMYLDSPLYINKINLASIKTANESDSIAASSGTNIKKTENENEFIINVLLPGQGEIYFNDSSTARTKYVYHFIAKRLPGDGPGIEPEVQLGNIKTMNATVEQIRSQSEIKVNGGLFFESATVYFTGNGFKDVIIGNIQKKLSYVKCYLDLCLPGSTVVFDNVRVHDKNNKIYAADGIVIHVIDSSYLDDPSTDYVSMNTYPDFYGTNSNIEHYIKNELMLSSTDSIIPITEHVFLMLRIGTSGEILSPCEDERTMSKLEEICFNIIKHGPKWTPGTFREQPVPMIVPISFNVNADEFIKK